MNHLIDFKKILVSYKTRIDDLINQSLPRFGSSSPLKQACEYALLNGGKRFRPALVFMIAEALNSSYDVSEAALAVEFFHTSSLIADDLPCMDNDPKRRGKPSTHIVFGEATALLASYALISAGYEALAFNVDLLKQNRLNAEEIGILALKNAVKNTGILGATGGQFLDLYPPFQNEAIYMETILKKTVTLFEISMVFGWLFGGGDIQRVPLIQRAAYHYGMAFQIADDFDDALMDKLENRTMNAISLFGGKEAKLKLDQEIASYLQVLQELQIETPKLISLVKWMNFS